MATNSCRNYRKGWGKATYSFDGFSVLNSTGRGPLNRLSERSLLWPERGERGMHRLRGFASMRDLSNRADLVASLTQMKGSPER